MQSVLRAQQGEQLVEMMLQKAKRKGLVKYSLGPNKT